MKLIILRGLPSSGKSTLANKLANGDKTIICSADDYFGATCEEYVKNWHWEKIQTAHAECIKKVRLLMENKSPLIIVDNTHTQQKEIDAVLALAYQFKYEIQIQEPETTWWLNDIVPYLKDKESNREHLEKICELLYEKNKKTHRVPLESIKRMMFRYQPTDCLIF
jgi:predicted kinase